MSGIRFAYSGHAEIVLDIDALTIEAGENIAVIGASGAGKTTLLNLIDGRLLGWSGQAEVLGRSLSPTMRPPRGWKADVGFVFQDMALIDRLTVFENVRIGRLGRTHPLPSLVGRFCDADIAAVERAIADVGFVFQDMALIDRLTVFENVRIGRLGRTHLLPSLVGRFRGADITAVERAIDDVGLKALADQRVDRLSGGERQRVGVARCLAQEPSILIADEPISNLDPASAEKILGLLKTSAEARDATLIVSSHQPKLVAGFVDRIVGLRDGRVVYDEPAGAMLPDDLVEFYEWQPAQPAA